MAQQVLVQWVDDLDGGEAVETIPFSLDGVSYEIDLSDENAEHLRNELSAYVAAARRTGGRRIRRTAVQATSAKSGRPREIREWAQQNGFEVSARGRLSAEIEEAYEKAHTEAEPAKAGRKRASRRKAK
ncbi:histone-like nucleoid-structuring protein Lsr2 [Amycolatopsis pigmentata]|uniref:Lsr2 family protein n=1 Tax=Amycolatopsis pigmentata TaxID=450801 RepID=A0ABW5FMA4_9PSEU